MRYWLSVVPPPSAANVSDQTDRRMLRSRGTVVPSSRVAGAPRPAGSSSDATKLFGSRVIRAEHTVAGKAPVSMSRAHRVAYDVPGRARHRSVFSTALIPPTGYAHELDFHWSE